MTTLKPFSLAKVYGLLGPGPVVLLTTARPGRGNAKPRANVTTMSWHMMMEFELPRLAGAAYAAR